MSILRLPRIRRPEAATLVVGRQSSVIGQSSETAFGVHGFSVSWFLSDATLKFLYVNLTGFVGTL
jgi:hypothetical protein